MAQIFCVKPPWLDRIRIARISRTIFEAWPGMPGGMAALETVLVEELKERRDTKSAAALSTNDWLKQTCYQIILVWHFAGYSEEIEDRIERHGRFKRGKPPAAPGDIFQRGVVGLFAAHPATIRAEHRHRLTDPMWSGFRHYIPPALLNAFNAGFPSHNGARADWRDYIEPQLEEWVKEQRVYSMVRECPLDEFRGPYSSAIEQSVERALGEPQSRAEADW